MIHTSSLGSLIDQTDNTREVRRSELHFGDWLVVRTRNSSYSIVPLGDGRFAVSGGWFDLQGLSPATMTINGCTFGGTAIRTDLVAAPGLFLEFGNRVLTTRIQKVCLIQGAKEPDATVH